MTEASAKSVSAKAGKPFEKTYLGVFVYRLIPAFFVIAASYNPTGTSVFHWVKNSWFPTNPVVWITVLVLLGAHGWCLSAFIEGMRWYWKLLTGLIAGMMAWTPFYYGWVNLQSTIALQWIGIFLLSFIYALSLSFAIWKRRSTGIIGTDDIGDDMM